MVAAIYTGVNLATTRAIVDGESMLPTFQNRQLVIVNRLVYFFGQPQRGDVAVLHSPTNADEDLIKRVIGLPGEQVSIRAGVVYIDGMALTEAYIEASRFCPQACDGNWTVAEDEYFVLGDNRANSRDSHVFGAVKKGTIVGMAWIRYYPFHQMGLVEHPRYEQD